MTKIEMAFPSFVSLPTNSRMPNGQLIETPQIFVNDGLTKREWFAGMALASIPLRSWDTETYGNDMEKIKAWARCAYLVADAMLEPPTGDTK